MGGYQPPPQPYFSRALGHLDLEPSRPVIEIAETNIFSLYRSFCHTQYTMRVYDFTTISSVVTPCWNFGDAIYMYMHYALCINIHPAGTGGHLTVLTRD